jgi:pheromone shutdown-related protein TraB
METNMQQTVKELSFTDSGKEIILVGTAHISKESVEEVEKTIRERNPDCVAIELDEQRYASIKDPDSWKNLDIVKVLKEKRGFIMLANVVLSAFQRRMGADIGVKPGDEMRRALHVSEDMHITSVMVDRPIQTTLKRAWAKNSLWGKIKLLTALLTAAFEKEEISAEQIESLKSSNEMDSMMAELANSLPTVKQVLIDERDQYLASHIWDCPGKKIVAVLGAGHLPGVQEHLAQIAAGKESTDVSEIENVPVSGIGSKIAGWIFPLLLVCLIGAGFFMHGAQTSVTMLSRWLLWNGSLAALGALAAFGHPLAVLVGFFGAPLATLNPFLAVGLFTGLVQAWARKPKVEDMEHLIDDAVSLKGLYKNRIGRVLLVFFFSSLGGAIGNFIAVPALISSLFH